MRRIVDGARPIGPEDHSHQFVQFVLESFEHGVGHVPQNGLRGAGFIRLLRGEVAPVFCCTLACAQKRVALVNGRQIPDVFAFGPSDFFASRSVYVTLWVDRRSYNQLEILQILAEIYKRFNWDADWTELRKGQILPPRFWPVLIHKLAGVPEPILQCLVVQVRWDASHDHEAAVAYSVSAHTHTQT